MRTVLRTLLVILPVLGMAITVAAMNNQVQADEPAAESVFPKEIHYLLPPPAPLLSDPNRSIENEHVAYGAVDEREELEQPIAYSHKLHAGTLQINCEYCHSSARRTQHAGVPSTSVCMNCHQLISTEDRPELQKLVGYYERGETIPWVKVHDIPDFVYFSHKGHVRGGVLCQECHGEIQADHTVARRVAPLTMGWCLTCHENHPSIDENYGVNAELRRAEIKDCWNCHK